MSLGGRRWCPGIDGDLSLGGSRWNVPGRVHWRSLRRQRGGRKAHVTNFDKTRWGDTFMGLGFTTQDLPTGVTYDVFSLPRFSLFRGV